MCQYSNTFNTNAISFLLSVLIVTVLIYSVNVWTLTFSNIYFINTFLWDFFIRFIFAIMKKSPKHLACACLSHSSKLFVLFVTDKDYSCKRFHSFYVCMLDLFDNWSKDNPFFLNHLWLSGITKYIFYFSVVEINVIFVFFFKSVFIENFFLFLIAETLFDRVGQYSML